MRNSFHNEALLKNIALHLYNTVLTIEIDEEEEEDKDKTIYNYLAFDFKDKAEVKELIKYLNKLIEEEE